MTDPGVNKLTNVLFNGVVWVKQGDYDKLQTQLAAERAKSESMREELHALRRQVAGLDQAASGG